MPIGEAVQDIFLVNLWWNFYIFMQSMGKLTGCHNWGLWGLFWYDDNGEMMNNCFLTGGQGAQAEYILS